MPRRYDSADAKRRILTACVRFFLEKGYTRTTVAEIVKEADVSISTFQNVFRTKDGVLVELVKFMFGSQFDMAGQIAGQKLPPVYVYAVETSIQLALTELNENLRDIYLEAYSHTEASEYIYQHTSSELYRIFGPYLPIHMKAPNFGCSAFCTQGTDGHTLMGRNYDFKNDTSAMLVYCTPKDGYASVAFAALDNINANTPDASMAKKLATLTAPFICLDGMNEKGVSIAVLTLDSDPTYQQTGKPMIATTLAIRLVLDRAATTAEAVELLSKYDMFASSGRDYHFYITDASGDGRVLEYDCNDPARPLTVTPSRSVTNFFVMYKDNVLPNQRNGVYGHGRERYDAIEEILDANAGSIDREIAWQALQAASQAPNPQDVTSNTQWSILYDNTALTAEAVIRRDWNTKTSYNLVSNVAVTDVG